MVFSGAVTWNGTAPWFPAISASWMAQSSATSLVYFGIFGHWYQAEWRVNSLELCKRPAGLGKK